IWIARYHRRESRFDEAMITLRTALRDRPDDPMLWRELAWCVLANGLWGRDAKLLLEARSRAKPSAELREAIANADRLLRAFGGSLERAATDPSLAAVRSPESAFAYVGATAKADESGQRSGIVMIAWTLGAGGAERVLARCFNKVRSDARFG